MNSSGGDQTSNSVMMMKLSQLNLKGDSSRTSLPNGKTYHAVEQKNVSNKPLKFIPSIPDSYCFVDENFHSDAFSVDGFVKRNSKRVHSLEKLKEELTSYQKLLKHSMVELINEDYTEFINLSTNLISFDKSIANIKTPILKIQEETSHVQTRIEDIIVQLTAKQSRLKAIRENKRRLGMILEVSGNLKRVEALLPSVAASMRTDLVASEDYNQQLSTTSNTLLTVDSTLEETATLVGRIQLNLDYLEESLSRPPELEASGGCSALLPKLKHRFEVCSQQFYGLLERKLYYLLTFDLMKLTATREEETRCEQVISRSVEIIIRHYLLSGNQARLEDIISENLVKPAFDELISDAYIARHGVQSMFDGVLAFLDTRCALLIRVLTTTTATEEEGNTRPGGLSTLGYELLTRTVWRHLVEDCIVRCSALFSLANADAFYRHYLTTCRFTEAFLAKTGLAAHRERFEAEPATLQLKGKFNLNVYFFMRLQQLVPALERGFHEGRFSLVASGSSQQYRTKVATLVHACLQQCWTLDSSSGGGGGTPDSNEPLFVGDLFGYLWKISLKVLARYASWIAAVDVETVAEWLRTAELPDASRSRRVAVSHSLAAFIHDSQLLLANFAALYQTVITPLWFNFFERMQAKIETSKTAAGNRRGVLLQRNSLDGSLTEAVTAFHAVATQHLLHLLKVEITGECAPLLDIVNDIPRLYRRTNKEKPARASAYVGRCVQQLAELIGLIGGGGDQQQQQWRTAWLADLLTELSGHYRNATLEVLTSVQRTEDSLKKLKKANQKAMAAATGATSRASSMSDDDKIRLQIYFDVQELGVEVQRRLNFDLYSVKPYRELAEMVSSLKILI